MRNYVPSNLQLFDTHRIVICEPQNTSRNELTVDELCAGATGACEKAFTDANTKLEKTKNFMVLCYNSNMTER
jgi:hypothetical protein